MGDHYVPQHYLAGFTSGKDNRFWVYQKGTDHPFLSQPKSVANINDLYPDYLEHFLADDIENPAKSVLDKIRNRCLIDHDDKQTLARYMVALWKRVPATRTRIQEMLPQITREYSEHICKVRDELVASDPQDAGRIRHRHAEIKTVIDRLALAQPDQFWHAIISPDRSPLVLDAISTMTWTFLTVDAGPVFLTCDNPFFYFTSIGLDKPESEVSFPISSRIVLWATWRTDLPEGYIPVRDAVVKEMNRRTVSNATRYVFHVSREEWVARFVNKPAWQLNRLNLICHQPRGKTRA